MQIASVCKTAGAVFAGVFLMNLMSASEPASSNRHELIFGSYLWGETGDMRYEYGVVPYVGRPFPNNPVSHGLDFSGEFRDNLQLAYRYRLNDHWRIQLAFSQAKLRFTGEQSEFISKFDYQFYQYWDGSWGEPMEVVQVYQNNRQPRIDMDLQTFSLGMQYVHPIGKFELGLGAGVDYSLARNGRMRDLFFASSQIGSRSILFNSAGYLSAELEDVQYWGTNLEVSVAYPIVKRLSVFVSARLQWFDRGASQVQSVVGEPEVEYGIETWYIYNDEDLQNRTDMQPLDGGSDSSLSIGVGFRFEL